MDKLKAFESFVSVATRGSLTAAAKAEGVRYLGTSIASLSTLQRVLVVGSNLRKDHPLFAQRLRQAARRGAQVHSLHALADDWLMPTATRIVVVAFPSDASLTLDGESVGHGSLDLSLVLDGTPHTLVVQAAGHQPQTVSFTTAPPPARIQLVRAHRPVSSMAGAGVPDAPPPSMRPPADEELRDSR